MENSSQATGKIKYAVHNGSYILKLNGDVRAVFCASIDSLLNTILTDKDLTGILIDLNAVSNIDSTSLGMLAKIAVKTNEKLDTRPIIVSKNPDINRILETMGFKKVFYILDQVPIFVENKKNQSEKIDDPSNFSLQDMLKDIPHVSSSQQEICAKVLEAHRVLMGLNSSNKKTFKHVVDELEKEQQRQKNNSQNINDQIEIDPQSTFNHH